MDKLDILKEFTERLALQIDDSDSEVLERLIALREEVIEDLQHRAPLSDEDKAKIQIIQSHHDVLVGRMAKLRDEASQGLQRIQQTRLQKRSYEAPGSINAIFFDKKK
ncbi:hypothetical protein SAMN05216312_109194 [Cohnella sp. OV330]|uniref:hypothetical protein n=1 Tax=Cohnella sp. OV330 TaxID=1855288 RepID=UPI0008F03DAA|nr:hypothetical protein [Cohnella sp. OV330]SFB47753.1 hypothetical protein SAMN05216312_109194 [Cohnella sp. OV330]